MIDTKELRRLLEEDGKNNIDLDEIHELLDRLETAESEVLEQARLNGMGSEREATLMAKLEAAEKDVALKEEVIDSLAAVVKRLNAQCDAAEKEREMDEERIADLMADLNRVGHEIDALRAKITEMEKQEPVAWMHETRRDSDVVTDAVKHVWGKVAVGSMAAYSIPLYALPGAKGE